MVATIWYPPERWQPGETIITETLPWPLGTHFHIGLAVLDGDDFRDVARRFVVTDATGTVTAHHRRTWVHLGSFRREGRYLAQDTEPIFSNNLDFSFAGGIRLTGYRYRISSDVLTIVLAWRTDKAVAENYTVFVHLVTADGHRIAQSDAQPHWAFEWPTSRWVPGELVLDGHMLNLPTEVPRDNLRLEIGLYLWPSLQRLSVLDAAGRPVTDHIEIALSLPTS
jgi:hypothetical protein